MSTTEGFIPQFQDVVAQLPEWLQPLGVAVAGTIPFVEGEGGAAIGVIGGIVPVVAAVAAAAGNFLAVLLIVLVGVRTREAVVTRGGRTPAAPSARREKFDRAFSRYGVAGVSLLGPLLIPTHFTAAALAASGVGKARILTWQGIAIALWTTGVTLVITGVIRFVG